jgi:hypothetical protein
MTRIIVTLAALVLLVCQAGTAAAQTGASRSDTLVPIPGTGTAEVKGARLIGADVIGPANDKLGDVDEVLVTTDGRVNAIVVATGGVLGVGERKVVLPWERLRFSSQGRDLVVKTDVGRETLAAMPEYRDPSRASTDQQPGRNGAGNDDAPPQGPLDTSRPIRPAPPTN